MKNNISIKNCGKFLIATLFLPAVYCQSFAQALQSKQLSTRIGNISIAPNASEWYQNTIQTLT